MSDQQFNDHWFWSDPPPPVEPFTRELLRAAFIRLEAEEQEARNHHAARITWWRELFPSYTNLTGDELSFLGTMYEIGITGGLPIHPNDYDRVLKLAAKAQRSEGSPS